jgi:hypothetical protein
VAGSRGGHGERLERALVMVVETLEVVVVVVVVVEVIEVVVLSFYRRRVGEVLGFWRHLNNGSESCVCTDGRRTSQPVRPSCQLAAI